MKLPEWTNVPIGLLIVAGCAYGVSLDRERQMAPHPGTAWLKRTVATMATDMGGGVSVPIDVMEKASSVRVTARVVVPSGGLLLAPAITQLERDGFKRHAFSESRYAVLCKGETVIDIDTQPSESSPSRVARIDASWGLAPVFGGTRETCPAGSR
jgi:hypothetical protein